SAAEVVPGGVRARQQSPNAARCAPFASNLPARQFSHRSSPALFPDVEGAANCYELAYVIGGVIGEQQNGAQVRLFVVAGGDGRRACRTESHRAPCQIQRAPLPSRADGRADHGEHLRASADYVLSRFRSEPTSESVARPAGPFLGARGEIAALIYLDIKLFYV